MNQMKKLLAEEELLRKKEILISNVEGMDHPKLFRISCRLKEIHHEMYELEKQKRKELKNAITPTLLESPLVETYLGIYKNQRGPYVISSITPLDRTTLELTALSTPYYSKYHKNNDRNIKQELIILRELAEKEIFRYRERVLKPEDISDYPNIKVANLNIKDQNKNNYNVTMIQRNDDAILYECQEDRYQKYSHYLGGSIIGSKDLNSDAIHQEFSRICQESKIHSSLNGEYFTLIEQEVNQLDLLRELEKNRTRKR